MKLPEIHYSSFEEELSNRIFKKWFEGRCNEKGGSMDFIRHGEICIFYTEPEKVFSRKYKNGFHMEGGDMSYYLKSSDKFHRINIKDEKGMKRAMKKVEELMAI